MFTEFMRDINSVPVPEQLQWIRITLSTITLHGHIFTMRWFLSFIAKSEITGINHEFPLL